LAPGNDGPLPGAGKGLRAAVVAVAAGVGTGVGAGVGPGDELGVPVVALRVPTSCNRSPRVPAGEQGGVVLERTLDECVEMRTQWRPADSASGAAVVAVRRRYGCCDRALTEAIRASAASVSR